MNKLKLSLTDAQVVCNCIVRMQQINDEIYDLQRSNVAFVEGYKNIPIHKHLYIELLTNQYHVYLTQLSNLGITPILTKD